MEEEQQKSILASILNCKDDDDGDDTLKWMSCDDKIGGLSGAAFFRVRSSTDATFVVKRIAKEKMELSKTLGLPREALFYEKFADGLDGVVPKCAFAQGDMNTGRKIVVMEDMKG